MLPRSSSLRCLGVWINDKLSLKDRITRVRQKCFGVLTKLRRYRKVLPTALKRKFFQAFVLPHADHCAVVWQECTKEL